MKETRQQLLEKLKHVLAMGVERPLKAVGYRKRGFRYLRNVAPGLLHLVEIQRGRFPSPDETEFTASCGAHLEMVWLIYPDRFDVGKPQESCCLVRSRIGFLGSERLDIWWTIKIDDDNASLQRIVDDLRGRIVDQVLPWLSQFESARAIGEYLVASAKAPGRIRYPYREIVQDVRDLRDAAIAYFAAGDSVRATALLDLAATTGGTARSKEMTSEVREGIERLMAQRQAHRAKS
jgi:hypothetical protein